MRRRVGTIAIGLLLVLPAAWWAMDRAPARPEPVPVVLPVEVEPAREPAQAPEPPSEPEGHEVSCPVPAAFAERQCTVALGTPGPPPRFADPVQWTAAGTLWFRARADAGGGLVRCRDTEKQARFAWERAAGGWTCALTLPPPADAPLFGRVRGAEDLPDGTVFLEGCGADDNDPVDADGGFFVAAAAGACRMRAWRRAGSLRLPGPWTEVEALAGHDVEVELSVPTFEPAGLGIGIEAVEGGVRVTFVAEGTPAAQAGLAAGDILRSVDGVSTAGMDLEDFVQHAIGPAGTEVTVAGTDEAGEPFEATVRRARIELSE